jgi:signal transduction histidine kinase
MKLLIRFFFLPIIAFAGLNILLLLYANDFQNRVSDDLRITLSANEYLASLSSVEAKLNRYLVSRQPTDSLEYAKELASVESQITSIDDLYSSPSKLVDSLATYSKLYLRNLIEFETRVLTNNSLTKSDLLELSLKTEIAHAEIERLVTVLNKDKDLGIIISFGEASDRLRYLFVAFFLILFINFALAYWLFAKPLKRLSKELLRLSEGTFAQIDIDRDDEIGDLIKVFNKTSHHLMLSEEKLKKANRELAVTNTELQSFAYSVSHDLRSPLRSIFGFSEALVNNYATELSETAQDYLNRVHRAANKMGELIDEILKLSRISRREVSRQNVDITLMAHEIIELTTTSENENYIYLIEDNLSVFADEGLTKIILLNLLSNAVKFSKNSEDPVIEVGSKVIKGIPYIFVKDKGAGFDMKYIDKIFGAFQRLHDQSEYSGTGIGLATVKRIINKHRGEIFYESEKNKGTTAYFNLESP